MSQWAAYPAQLRDDLALALRVTTSGQGEVVDRDPRSIQAHLPTLSCLGVGGTLAQVAPVQTIWGLLYDASGLMDEVQDGDPGRLPTRERSLNAAMAAFFEASSRIGDLNPRMRTLIFSRMRQVLGGQAAEAEAHHPSVQDSLQIADNKSGAFMGLGCALGALAAGADEPTVAALEDFGRACGALVQIRDDLEWLEQLGVETGHANERDTNLVLAIAQEFAPPTMRDQLTLALDGLRAHDSLESGQALRSVLVTSGARARCALYAAQYALRARSALECVQWVDQRSAGLIAQLAQGIFDSFRPRT